MFCLGIKICTTTLTERIKVGPLMLIMPCLENKTITKSLMDLMVLMRIILVLMESDVLGSVSGMLSG